VEEKLEKIEEAYGAAIRLLEIEKDLKEGKVLDWHELSELIMKVSHAVNYMRYKPHEWLKRDKQFYNVLMIEVKKIVRDEVGAGLAFALYEERPDKIVEVIKQCVEDFMEKWEVDTQVAEQIVENVLKQPKFIERIVVLITPLVTKRVVDWLITLDLIDRERLKVKIDEVKAKEIEKEDEEAKHESVLEQKS